MKLTVSHTIEVDDCIADEVRELNYLGIITLACCCGHGKKKNAFIAVHDDSYKMWKGLLEETSEISSFQQMLSLGYKLDKEGYHYTAHSYSSIGDDKMKIIPSFRPKSKCHCKKKVKP